jgi:hypothetical protein
MQPFAELNLDEGEWTAYVFYDSDYEKHGLPAPCLILRDGKRLAEGLSALSFTPPNGGDVATVTSSLVIVRDARPILETQILLGASGPDGLQSRGYGWIEATPRGALRAFVKQFEVVEKPEVVPRLLPELTPLRCAREGATP